MKYDTKRRQAATPERLCDCGRQAVMYKSNSYVCSYCLSQPPASAYLDHGGSECEPFQVHLASYDPEVSADENVQDMRSETCVLAVLALLLSLLTVRADYTVQSSTNLTEWTASAVSWTAVLEMVRANPATVGNAAYYYRLSPEIEPSVATTIPQGLTWNYVTNLTGVEMSWASDQTNLVQVGDNLWVIQNPATVFLVSPTSTNAMQSSTTLAEWIMTRTSALEAELSSDGFHTARQAIPPPPSAPIKERVSIGDPFFPIQKRTLTWDYIAPSVFEIWWGSSPDNLVQVGETTNRHWLINIPARLGWFGVRARNSQQRVSAWTTAPNLK